ncbi:O-antigen polymerase [Limosilactobacillus reuteri]|uniref:O-antigen polymerase n=1 Tax=Limosilactobacillus reuteri TaxID=1598 RepID=UPI000857BC8A|nr:O-antigen polymerase [Limosilactobacillus reuteri]OCW66985.1 hypothetical protein BBP11_03115 [Limosilactobacillus reuteri]
MVTFLVIGCLILLIISYYLFNRSIISPSLLITGGFFISSINLYLNRNTWYFNSKLTIILILAGLITFMIGCYIVNLIFRSKQIKEIKDIKFNSFKIRLIVYLLFQLLLYFIILFWIVRSQGGGISASLSSFHANSMLGITGLPGVLNILNIINMSGVYLIFYLTIYYKIKLKKIPHILFANDIVALIGSLFTGNRTIFSMYIMGLFILYFLMIEKKERKLSILNLKYFLSILIILCLGIIAFMIIALLQGRSESNVSLIYNLSTYMGGPLKNLEIFVNKNVITRQVFAGQTFMDTYNWLATTFGISQFKITNLYTYNWVFENGIGNVYSIFMPLYNDFGISGLLIFMFLLGSFSQYVYCSALYKQPKNDISYYTIFYSYLGFSLFMSFFSNKIGESIFSRAGIYFIIGLWIFDLILCRPIFNEGNK